MINTITGITQVGDVVCRTISLKLYMYMHFAFFMCTLTSFRQSVAIALQKRFKFIAFINGYHL